MNIEEQVKLAREERQRAFSQLVDHKHNSDDLVREFVRNELSSALENRLPLKFVVSRLYWEQAEYIPISILEEVLNLTREEMLEITGPRDTSVPCRVCCEPIDLLAKDQDQEAYFFRLGITCPRCSRLAHETQKDQGIQRGQRIAELRSMPYEDYLKSPEWQALRQQAHEVAGGRCQVCNRDDRILDVHHRTYERRGCEELTDLTVLCRDCHTLFHDNSAVVRSG